MELIKTIIFNIVLIFLYLFGLLKCNGDFDLLGLIVLLVASITSIIFTIDLLKRFLHKYRIRLMVNAMLILSIFTYASEVIINQFLML